jgi:hypothetical protein
MTIPLSKAIFARSNTALNFPIDLDRLWTRVCFAGVSLIGITINTGIRDWDG